MSETTNTDTQNRTSISLRGTIIGALSGALLISIMPPLMTLMWGMGLGMGFLAIIPFILLSPGMVIITKTMNYPVFEMPSYLTTIAAMIAPVILGALFGTKNKKIVTLAAILSMLYLSLSVLAAIYVFLHL